MFFQVSDGYWSGVLSPTVGSTIWNPHLQRGHWRRCPNPSIAEFSGVALSISAFAEVRTTLASDYSMLLMSASINTAQEDRKVLIPDHLEDSEADLRQG